MRVLAAALSMALVGMRAYAQPMPAGFVDAADVVPALAVEMRYAGSHNFVGRSIDGYEAPRCWLTRAAAQALAAVQNDLAPSRLGLKVFDCYRPARAVAHFARWARDPGDTLRKAEFYPGVDKQDLFRLGYVAHRSAHSRGSTVDITLIDRASGRELDMGTAYDVFSPRSSFSHPGVTAEQRANRARLRSAMARRGFAPYEKEWWHFTLRGEPFPGAFFDVPVQ